MLSLILAAAEPSKAPFYIVGGALALAAVAISWVGLSQPEFPRTDGAERRVMIAAAVFALAAILAAVLTDP